MSWEYGNTRIAAQRARLPDAPALARLAEAPTPAAFVAALERDPEWRIHVRDAASLGLDATGIAYAAIERHRAARLGALPAMYDGGSRALVEALVMPLDVERLVAIMRRRHAGEPPDAIGATVIRGALLDAPTLGRIVRARSPAAALALVARGPLVEPADRRAIQAAADLKWPDAEAAIVAAIDRSRAARAGGRGTDAAFVRSVIDRERADRRAAEEELAATGAATASLIERTATLAQFDELAAIARRIPLGAAVVAAYVAAIGAVSIRLRVALARVAAGWTADAARPWLIRGTTRWPAWS